MIITRDGQKPIIKREIGLNELEPFSQEKIDSVTPLLKKTIEENPISTFGLITLMREHFQKSLYETFYTSNFDYSQLNANCYYLAKLIKKELEQESITGYLLTYEAYKYALTSGDAKVKEAHVSVLYPTIRNGQVFYTIFDPGLKIDKPLSFYQYHSHRDIKVDDNTIDIIYEPENAEYPYYMNMTGQNKYSYNKNPHTIYQRFNPLYETINVDEMLFPISYQLLTGYKAMTYSTDPQKRAYITLNHLSQRLIFSDCIKGIEYQYSYEEIEKMGYAKLKEKILSICHKLQLNPDDITSNIFFMIYYHNDYINYIMDQDVIKEYAKINKLKTLTRN